MPKRTAELKQQGRESNRARPCRPSLGRSWPAVLGTSRNRDRGRDHALHLEIVVETLRAELRGQRRCRPTPPRAETPVAADSTQIATRFAVDSLVGHQWSLRLPA